MTNNKQHCPACGQAASGNFCSHCGAALAGTGTTKQWSPQNILPWVATGIAVIALVIAVVAVDSKRAPVPTKISPHALPGASQQATPFALPMAPPPSMSTPGAPGTPPDLSTMSPREAADRLFNRIMASDENGKKDEALRFAPMAVAAYNNLPALDNDARYHLALIHLVANELQQTREQLAKIRETVPKHLLAYMVERSIANRQNDKDGEKKAFKGFLAAYETEFLTSREEYKDHQGSIDRFRKAAQASLAGKK